MERDGNFWGKRRLDHLKMFLPVSRDYKYNKCSKFLMARVATVINPKLENPKKPWKMVRFKTKLQQMPKMRIVDLYLIYHLGKNNVLMNSRKRFSTLQKILRIFVVQTLLIFLSYKHFFHSREDIFPLTCNLRFSVFISFLA